MNPLPLGRTVATPAALIALQEAGVDPAFLLERHRNHDWGSLNHHDHRANQQALADGSRVFSSYVLPTGIKVWIITESDRSSTCILLPSDY